MRGTILKRILLLAVIFVTLDTIYRFTLYPAELNKHAPEIVQIRETQALTDIYYFGESSNVTYAKNDSVQKSISELVQDCYPGVKVTNINKYATHAGVFREWLSQLEMPAERPRAVIVTMNLRSFGAAWIHSRLETPLMQSLVLAGPYPPLLNRFLLSLGAFDDKTVEEREHDMQREWDTNELQFPFDFKYRTTASWDAGVANGGYLNPDGSWDMPKIELACHYIKAYAFNIKEDNPRLRDFDAIHNWCRDNDLSLYFNLMAENISYADSLVGKELVFLMRQNRDILIERYQSPNCTVIDNLENVDEDWFIDKDWTTEHYTYPGRLTIARTVCDSLSRQFSYSKK